jgi:hypothetical protein
MLALRYLLPLALLAAVPDPASPGAPSTGWRLVATKPFDPNQVTFYWEGAPIRSPATFTTDGREIKVNGVTVLPTIPSDTAGVNARIAAVFAGVPLVDSLVAKGSSYEHAVDEYGCEMGRRLRRALRPSLTAVRTSGTSQGTPQLNAIAEELRIPHEAIRVRDRTLECIIAGGVHLKVALDSPDSVLLADPCAPPSPETRRAGLEQRVGSTVTALGEPGPRLVIGDQARTMSYVGPAATKAMEQVRQAVEVYRRGGADAVRSEAKDFLVPAHVLIVIARRQAGVEH